MSLKDRVVAMLDRRGERAESDHAARYMSDHRTESARRLIEARPGPLVADGGLATLPVGTVLYQYAREGEAGSLSWEDGFCRSFRSAAILATTDTPDPEGGQVNAYVLTRDVSMPLLPFGASDRNLGQVGIGYVENAGGRAGEFDTVHLTDREALRYHATYDVSGNETLPSATPWGLDDGIDLNAVRGLAQG